MKHDKHKSAKRASYKKQHGIPTEKSTKKAGISTECAPPKEQQRKLEQGTPIITTDTVRVAQLRFQLEKEHEMLKEYSRRKIVSNWTKYEDFPVDQETEVYSEPRGEDFQKLVSKSDDSASQLRMKDEVWLEEDDEEDETETEIRKLFKVDFYDVARRLEAIPLHERLGIPAKYFEEDLLQKINEDAEEHARLYQEHLDSEISQNLYNPASSDITRSSTGNQTSIENSELTVSVCKSDRLQGEADSHEQSCDDTSRTNSDRGHCATDAKHSKSSQVVDVTTPNTVGSDSSCSHHNLSGSTTSVAQTASSNETTLAADVNAEPHNKPDEEDNLEEWLDDILDD